MSLKQLIKDQKVQFHTHHRGGGQLDEWGRGVHLHKKMMGKPPRGRWELIFPLDDDTRAIWRGPGMTQSDFDSISREVRKALKSHTDLEGLKTEVLETVARYTPKGDQHIEQVLANARAAAQRVANHFDIGSGIVEEMVKLAQDRVSAYTSLHKSGDEAARYVAIAQEAGRISLSPTNRSSLPGRSGFPERCPWPGR